MLYFTGAIKAKRCTISVILDDMTEFWNMLQFVIDSKREGHFRKKKIDTLVQQAGAIGPLRDCVW